MVAEEEVKETFTSLLNGLTANFYDEGIVKSVQRLDKGLNRNGDYRRKRSMCCI
jgi:hypothetical protein